MISKAAVLANKWFKTDEISIATAIGSTGDLFGLAIGFLVPPFIVSTSSGPDNKSDMSHMTEIAVKCADYIISMVSRVKN